jgi:GNAT superfamily N-acetyltransferase
MQEFHMVNIGSPGNAEWTVVGGGIARYNQQQAGDIHHQGLCFMLYAVDGAKDGEAVGGIIGSTYWDWLYIDLLWLREDLRGQGYGHQLLTAAEDEARRRGAKNAYMDTFSFQAPNFYQQHGYRVFGTLDDFPVGHQRFFLTKEL